MGKKPQLRQDSEAEPQGHTKAERKLLVQSLVSSARALKVTPVRDDASRKKVAGMMALIRKRKGSARKSVFVSGRN